MSRAPLAGIAFFFMIGAVTGLMSDNAWFIQIFVLNFLLACILFCALRQFKKSHYWFSPLMHTSLVILLAFSTGWLRATVVYRYPASDISHLPGNNEDATILGEVITVNEANAPGLPLRFVLKAERAYINNNILPVTGLARVSIQNAGQAPVPGQLILLRGRIAIPSMPRNPGAFDYRAFLKQRGITRILQAQDFYVISEAAGPGPFIRRAAHYIRQQVDALLKKHIRSEDARSILKALFVGDQSSIAAETRLDFQQTGLTHVLAVSGLHVMLVGLLVYQLLRPMCLRLGFSWQKTEWIRVLVTLFILCLYMVVTGSKAPVVRAVLMAFLMIAGSLFQRPASSLNSVGVAALVLLIYRPAYVLDLGFQLSFSAVLSILLLLPVLMELLPRKWLRNAMMRAFLQSTLVSVSATLGTMPVLLYHFGYISFAGVLLNLFALPLTAASLSAGLSMILSAPVSGQLTTLFARAAEFSTQLLILVAQKGAQVFSFMTFAPGNISAITLSFLILGCFLMLVYPIPKYRWSMISYSLALFSIVIWTRLILASNTPAISMVFFDVGHGDACLIQLPNGKTMLVDTGNRSPYSDQAKQVILPFLASQGIDKLDVVLITHPHLDHMGGLGTLLSSIPVHRLIGGLQTRDLYQFTEGDTPFAGSITQVFAGDTLLLDPSVRIRIFSPTAQLAAHPNPNESSVVFQLQYGSHRYLFLGDAEQQAEQALSENYTALLYSDIVKVAHHGSRTSSTPTLITRLSTPAFSSHEKYHPHTAVISVGNGIRYGLPDEEVIERWQTAAVNTHVTASAGALWIKSDGLKISQVAY